MNLKKSDVFSALIIAEVDAWLILAISQNLKTEIAKVAFLPMLIKTLPILLPLLALAYIFFASFLKEKIPSLFQFVKFTLVGTLNSFLDLGILNLLIALFGITSGILYSLFKIISATISITNSYFWNKFWSFEKKETGVKVEEYSKFYLVSAIGFLLNVGVASFVVNIIKPQFGLSGALWANIGAVIAILCVISWNFSGYKFLVFKK